MTNEDLIENKKLYRILRDVYRHYLDYQDYMRRGEVRPQNGSFDITSLDVIEIPRLGISISFTDLSHGVSELPPRKKEAFFLNVICDQNQETVAKIMGIKPVTVGQYVDSACKKLCQRYFAELLDDPLNVPDSDT